MIDFARINQSALANLEPLLCEWLPGGRRNGAEFIAADLSGGKGGSLSVNLRTGLWADFAGDIRGGDPISLLAAIRGCKQSEAARELDTRLQAGGITGTAPLAQYETGRPASDDWEALPHAPPGTAFPTPKHPGHGTPTKTWVYRTATGELVGLVCRFELPDGAKEVLPYTWARNVKTGETRWKWKSFAKPRPLYRLDVLAAKPSAGVVVVEGEKTADAGQRLLGDSVVVTTWPGGSKAVAHTDWSPLDGRKVINWPDNDESGIAAAVRIRDILSEKTK